MHIGFCDTTEFGNVGQCSEEDKGAFKPPWRWNSLRSQEELAARCRQLCLACERCRFVSFSLEQRDCSWYHECDTERLRIDVAGFRTLAVRNASRADDDGTGQPSHGHQRGSQELLLPLWARLGELARRGHKGCWAAGCRTGPPWGATGATAALGMAVAWQTNAVNAEERGIYGHIWHGVDTFFTCAVLTRFAGYSGGVPNRSTVLIPAMTSLFATGDGGKVDQRSPAFVVLQKLLSGEGSRLSIVRHMELPACAPSWMVEGRCCLNATARAAAASLALAAENAGGAASGGGVTTLELRPQPRPMAHTREWTDAFRSVVWANLGVLAPPTNTGTAQQREVALLASSRDASNRRQMLGEEAAAAALAELFASRARPRLAFKRLQLESLAYRNEIRLLRRTKVFIALFGSGLHNCRFLPPDAIVVEIHGAMKGEIAKHMYRDLCQGAVGLRWVGYAVPGHADCCDPARPDYSAARVSATELVRIVAAALDGNFTTLDREYESRWAEGMDAFGRRQRTRFPAQNRSRF